MSKVHYFTDINLLQAQDVSGRFGSVLSSDSDYITGQESFRVSSHHTASSDPLAYAVINGQLLVQQHEDDINLVNILLKPNEQPSNDLPKIKYFIYRGILKNTLTDGVNVLNGGNTLTKSIIDHNPSTPQKVLGIELTGGDYSDSEPVDNAFYLPKPDFELWTVYGGWSLGSFDKDNIGFEIVFENLGYEITFNVLRTNRHLIKVDPLGGNPTQEDIFENKTKKQEILHFLDPCAFWGNHYNNVLFARSSNDPTDSNFVHEFDKKKNDDIYRELIEGGSISSPTNFYLNKNRVYLDIRNSFDDSINYFENYNDSLKISFVDDNNEPSTLFDYYNSGWPLLAIDSITGGGNNSVIRIAFPVSESMIPVVAVLTGERRISLGERIREGKSQFKSLFNNHQDDYTEDSLFLFSSNYNSGPAVGRYIKLKYLDQKLYSDDQISNEIPFLRKNPLDYTFQPTEFSQLFTTNDNLKIKVYESNVYINNLESFGIDYTANLGLANDIGNTILFWTLSKRNVKSRFKASEPSYSISSLSKQLFPFFTEYIHDSSKPDKIREVPAIVSGDFIQLLLEKKSKISFFRRRNNLDFNAEFFALILSNDDFEIILDTANSNFTSIYKPYLIASQEEEIIDDEGLPIIKIELSLKGLSADTNGNISILEVPTGLTIYSNAIKN